MNERVFTEAQVREIWEECRSIGSFREDGGIDWKYPKFDDYLRSKEAVKYPLGITCFEIKYIASVGKESIGQAQESDYNEWVGNHLKKGNIIKSVINSHGDKLSLGMDTNYEKIESFTFGIKDSRPSLTINAGGGNVIIAIVSGGRGFYEIDDVHPIKTFKTQDGFYVKDRDIIFAVDEKYFLISETYILGLANGQFYKIFKERKNAQEWINNNKPMFSKKQIMDARVAKSDFVDIKTLGL